MICPICTDESIILIYEGKIRNGTPGQTTDDAVKIYQCENCHVIWHKNNNIIENNALYESDSYRKSMGETVTLSEFYLKHDHEILDKLIYTGTKVYRDKIFMDIGCGGGGYADYIRGVARSIVLIEPNENFRKQLQKKDYEVFTYADNALDKYGNTIELITSYDVIEHIEEPYKFLQTIYKLLSKDGIAYIGTPTEYPVLRRLLGAEFDSFLFSVQHPWVFSRRCLEIMAEKIGFSEIAVMFYQRFGIGNLIAWLQTHEPKGEVIYDFITPAINNLWKSEMAKEETAEYIILRLRR
jgi:2-polyprenyl-3-methyl-5-hydroxy-6-metoxy-1,4-benzoquinol methylase